MSWDGSFIGVSVALAFFCLPAAMAVISFFCLDERLSQTALELEEAMSGLVQKGKREHRRLDANMAGPGV